MLHVLLIILHIIVCIALSVVVLLQSSKGGGLAGAFGGGGGSPQQMLGSRGMATLLHKLTIYLAVAFFITSFALFFLNQDAGQLNAGSGSSVMQDAAEHGEVQVPVTTPAPTTTPAGGGDAGEQGGGGNP
ncbi:preprotein translocase subunit SecG [bacterium DOLJORAL78_65_58]|nr:MAG: preprotein translocase subunit SecG [bacterium DOLZORAL124_64_63]PIE75556.1 MAG: preprotein translocase subunit SecG [bacterium DOLJORAL78_65_58]